MSELPANWCTASLSEICQRIVDGSHNPPKATDFGFPMLSARNINGYEILFDDYRFISEADFTVENARTMIAPGDVLLTIVGTIGRTAVVPQGSKPFALQRSVAVLKPVGVNSRYISYALDSPVQQQWLIDNAKGTAQKGVYLKTLGTLQIPIAPIAEQTRIVEKLEELFSDLDAGVAELKAAQKKLAQYRQSLLKAAVEGKLTKHKVSYQLKSLGDLVLSIGQGWSPRCENNSVNDDETWAVIKTTAIQPLHFDGWHNKQLPITLKPREHLELHPGDLLVTRAGPRSRVGITCLVRTTKKHLILCDKAYRLRCNEKLINPEFLELVLNAPHVVNELDSLKTGINDSGLNLTQDRFFTLMIPVPSLEEQVKIVALVEMTVINIEQQSKAIEHSLTQAAAQRKNILKSAFSAQLVPQDPSDEPASVLLERIRVERIKSTKTSKKTVTPRRKTSC